MKLVIRKRERKRGMVRKSVRKISERNVKDMEDKVDEENER